MSDLASTDLASNDLASNDLTHFIETIYNVYLNVYKNVKTSKNKKLLAISVIIYNYLTKLSIDHNITIKELSINEKINMIPFFKYIHDNNIELLDFENLQESDINIKNEKEIERFVLTHVYYLTQQK